MSPPNLYISIIEWQIFLSIMLYCPKMSSKSPTKSLLCLEVGLPGQHLGQNFQLGLPRDSLWTAVRTAETLVVRSGTVGTVVFSMFCTASFITTGLVMVIGR
ncbi:hypothetical protein NG799_01450 [Laspinema sp. D1]|uniref:Uncharacterized protein n=1 Tax=Laspinema palackyanum D2a TaxID=2953684 RepID=A0ABT2MM79_9CYAN|nr:hypothetical protein [Laspinema sp. D2a]